MTVQNEPDATLRQRHQALQAAEPGLRIRDRARRLGVSEAELVAAGCGVEAVALALPPQPLVQALGTLGRVMALTRNDGCVHERHGRYEDIRAEGHMGLVLGPDIDLRLFFDHWASAYAVVEQGRYSLQFFDHSGTAVHKVYRTEATDAQAWATLVARHASAHPPPLQLQPPVAPDAATEADDPAALRADWLALQDTHEFFPMLKRFKLTRLAALRAVGPDLAQPVPTDTAERVLQAAATSALRIMCFVANRGVVQIHSGPVQRLLRTGPWFNVLDPDFNLHLNTEAIAARWVVNKPTRDGWVTSLEVYDRAGSLMLQCFGERKPGHRELPAWRDLMAGLCPHRLAS
ncbi:hemin transporter [Caldimonas brevitalea]|uniref:Hemin transporter n=2 Tax=Caldimonas brevitalea TaxID=413882 RepID=A0A0G3BCY1_9BURK|nr:hemin transporter [Caldimonas brevitalea]